MARYEVYVDGTIEVKAEDEDEAEEYVRSNMNEFHLDCEVTEMKLNEFRITFTYAGETRGFDVLDYTMDKVKAQNLAEKWAFGQFVSDVRFN